MGEKSNILWCKILYDVKYFTPQVETLTNYNIWIRHEPAYEDEGPLAASLSYPF